MVVVTVQKKGLVIEWMNEWMKEYNEQIKWHIHLAPK
jgi:hypothetical protein